MELRHLKNFIALAEEKQFTAAARKMNIVQSGLSMSIKELEQELGTQLVNRSTRKVSLTAAGMQFLEHARISLAMLDAGVRVVRTGDNVVRGLLRLGVLQSLRPYIDLPKRLASFQRRHPQVEFSVRALSTPNIPDLVKSGEIDLSFHALLEKAILPGLVVTPFAEDQLVAICSVRNELAKVQDVTLERLVKQSFVDLSPDRALRKLVDRLILSSQARRRTVYEASDVETLLDFVAEDLGVAIVPARVATSSPRANRLVLLPFAGLRCSAPHWCIAILTPRTSPDRPRNVAVDLFLKSISPKKISSI